jgi:hypothetical protein
MQDTKDAMDQLGEIQKPFRWYFAFAGHGICQNIPDPF